MIGLRKTVKSRLKIFAMALGLLVRRIRADAPPELQEFSWTQKAVLSRLEKHGPATAADLAHAEGVKPQSMGTALGLLEKKGLVERKAHPTDGRQIRIKLTATGNHPAQEHQGGDARQNEARPSRDSTVRNRQHSSKAGRTLHQARSGNVMTACRPNTKRNNA